MGYEAKRRLRIGSAFVIMAVGLLFVGSRMRPEADAAVELTSAGLDNIIVVPVQVARDSYGIAMVDTAGKTLWVYEVSSRGPSHNRLRLLAARNWKYDQLLEDYNTGEPKPRQVKEILRKLSSAHQPQQEDEEKLEEMAQPEDN